MELWSCSGLKTLGSPCDNKTVLTCAECKKPHCSKHLINTLDARAVCARCVSLTRLAKRALPALAMGVMFLVCGSLFGTAFSWLFLLP